MPDLPKIPVRGFTPLDLAKHAEMITRCIAGPYFDGERPTVVLKADATGRAYAEVVVRLVGRPPLRITIEEGTG